MPTSVRTRTRLNSWNRARRGILAVTRAARLRTKILQAIKVYNTIVARRHLGRTFRNVTRYRRRGPSRKSRRLFKRGTIKTKRYRPQWRQSVTPFSMY